MSQINETRSAIVSTVAGLAGIQGVADVLPGALVSDCWFLSKGRPAVLVVYGGCKSVGTPGIGNRSQTAVEEDWYLVTVAHSLRSPTEAFTATNGADSLAEAVRQIRSTPVGHGVQANYVYLKLVSETVYAPEGRPEAGGPVAYVCHYRSSQVIV